MSPGLAGMDTVHPQVPWEQWGGARVHVAPTVVLCCRGRIPSLGNPQPYTVAASKPVHSALCREILYFYYEMLANLPWEERVSSLSLLSWKINVNAIVYRCLGMEKCERFMENFLPTRLRNKMNAKYWAQWLLQSNHIINSDSNNSDNYDDEITEWNKQHIFFKTGTIVPFSKGIVFVGEIYW